MNENLTCDLFPCINILLVIAMPKAERGILEFVSSRPARFATSMLLARELTAAHPTFALTPEDLLPPHRYEMAQEERLLYQADFAAWPPTNDEFVQRYFDSKANEYHITVKHPSINATTLLPYRYDNFDFEAHIASVDGHDFFYGLDALIQRGGKDERAYRFLFSPEGMFRYRQRDYDSSGTQEVALIERDLPEERGQESNFRIVRRGRNVHVFYNGQSIFHDDVFATAQEEMTLGLVVVARSSMVPDTTAGIALSSLTIRGAHLSPFTRPPLGPLANMTNSI